ncbi:inosose dehydratase [Geomicrobium sp. JCM 19037]|uniref:sugar phosphate isomerase/epimerase family protein n=1 Tax=Geomicrobium sp. JCM 19037 TaxID=1460634 RepID=UPI00045F4684|nr:sugar phosphate isomerase/epimerase [Geomicrobium sp. JCM 19037]GAK03037.1 inosose dehydratase [Geomicrobium sp. JCM 19037]
MMKKPIAIQLYTLRNEFNNDLERQLSAVGKMGFDGVEFAGGYWGHDVNETKRQLSDFGLRVAGSHVPFDKLKNEIDKVIEDQNTLGSAHIICPILPEQYRNSVDGYKEAASYLSQFGEKCSSHDIQFSYHNHAFELEVIDNTYPLEILFDETSPRHVKAELDVYWLKKAGEEPLEWLKKYNNRTPLIHLKDMTASDGAFAPLGTGGVNLESIIEYGEHEMNALSWWVFEQDHSEQPIADVEKSINYLKGERK